MLGYGSYDHNENIFNLVPPRFAPLPQIPMYRSKVNPKLPPTCSTFHQKSTSVPVCSNMAGDYNDKIVADKADGTFGKPLGTNRNDPSKFLSKKSRSFSVPSLREVMDTHPDVLKPKTLKPLSRGGSVPRLSEAPIMNLVTSKNFIVANAVEAILAMPRKLGFEGKDYMKKEDYGKTPKYLKNIKQDIDAEYDYIRMLQDQEDEERNSQMRPMSEDERLQLIAGLKAKWESVNTDYQGQTHLTILDTAGKMKGKEKNEAQLSQIEKDIEKLNRKNILVARDA